MSFSANLQHLRATRSMTQEQLAMLLGVSRQAVSKWESDAAYPEMDKLLCLCDIFECSLDELARRDLTHRAREHALAVSPGPAATDICDYDRRMRLRATLTASAVACIFLGFAGFCGTEGIAASAADAYRIASRASMRSLPARFSPARCSASPITCSARSRVAIPSSKTSTPKRIGPAHGNAGMPLGRQRPSSRSSALLSAGSKRFSSSIFTADSLL